MASISRCTNNNKNYSSNNNEQKYNKEYRRLKSLSSQTDVQQVSVSFPIKCYGTDYFNLTRLFIAAKHL